MWKYLIGKEQGQSMVIIALTLTGLVAMVGLAIDGGNAYLQRRKMQNASDAGAFAGAMVLANRGTDNSATAECNVRKAIEQYALSNGTPGNPPSANCSSLNNNVKAYFTDSNGAHFGAEIGLNFMVPQNAKGVQVQTNAAFSTFFLGVVGENNGAASAIAKASFNAIQTPGNIQPLGVECNGVSLDKCFTKGQNYDIFEGGGPGNFGWMSWDGSNNAPYIAAELDPNSTTINGYVDPVTGCSKLAPGCWVQGGPGVKNSSSDRAALDGWIGKTMVILIWDSSSGQGSNVNYHVVGFAAFKLISYDLPGKSITGQFVNLVAPGQICLSNCFPSGLTTVILRP